MWPYLANYAAMGLAAADDGTGRSVYAEAAWSWLAWYAAHQDARGFVTDHHVTDGVPISTGDMDSTDAYAGTFLLAVERTAATTPSRRRLVALAPAIARAVDAIEATQDADGLTWAKPSWHVKYLMDQAESYAGLRAAARLATTLGDHALADRASRAATRLRAGVDRLYDATTGAYDWAVHGDGARQSTDWTQLYPDALQQVWAVAYGLVPAPRADAIVARFLAAHPDWDRPDAVARIDGEVREVGFWVPSAWALSRVGLSEGAAAGVGHIRAAAEDDGLRWPFTVGDAGQLLVGPSLLTRTPVPRPLPVR